MRSMYLKMRKSIKVNMRSMYIKMRKSKNTVNKREDEKITNVKMWTTIWKIRKLTNTLSENICRKILSYSILFISKCNKDLDQYNTNDTNTFFLH